MLYKQHFRRPINVPKTTKDGASILFLTLSQLNLNILTILFTPLSNPVLNFEYINKIFKKLLS